MKTTICRLHGQKDLRIEKQEVPSIGAEDVLVHIKRGGICGSDLHYYQDGGFGPVRVKEPIILGHEIAGVVAQTGQSVTDYKAGNLVAVSPSHPCNQCQYCAQGQHQHCVDMRFLGSARTNPHVQGGLRAAMVVPQSQCFMVNDSITPGEAACAEPLAVCLHATKQAGELRGKRVLVTGAGPIGSLCVAVLAYSGVEQIIVTDLSEFTLSIAKRMGATALINVNKDNTGLEKEITEHGLFDIVFECSAAESAIHSAINSLQPRGILIQVGVTGLSSIPINSLVGKEINFKGSHRFHHEFSLAVELINKRMINLDPLITQTYPVDEAITAFEMARDRSKAMKVQLAFGEK